MKKQVLSVFFLFVSQICWAQFKLFSGTPVTITCDISEKQVVNTALDLFSRDCQTVFSAPLQRSKRETSLSERPVKVLCWNDILTMLLF